MSRSVTPTRRPREDDEDSLDDYPASNNNGSSARSNGSKRARLDEDEEDEEEEESEHDQNELLPDSFRRSPKGKGRAIDALTNGDVGDDEQNEHQPGSIVRVTLGNFVTYTKAEFHPGPNLNMIIGPNGTGKSTLVCAICLGLGWATSHLGRAKDIGEFVKHGAGTAEIEIELTADPKRHQQNPVITTKITKDGNKTEYLIDRKKSNRKTVQTLARSFSIQVDNLCQFLPQDRVVEFAALSPVNLLAETQRAAAPEQMTKWHEELKQMRKDQRQHESEQQRMLESLKADENRQKRQEADVVRLRERTELQHRLKALQKLRPFPEYNTARARFTEAKDRKVAAERELRRLKERLEPNMQAVQAKEHYLEQVDKIVGLRQRAIERNDRHVAGQRKKIDDADAKTKAFQRDIDAEKNATRGTKQNIPRLQRELSEIQRAIANPPAHFDAAAFNADIREKTRRQREVEAEAEELKENVAGLMEQVKQCQQIVQRCEQDKENLKSQAGQQVNKLRMASRDAAKAWDWIQNNRNAFKSKVFGPPIIECKVKDARHADAVESMIPDGEKLAFTVTSQEDFKMLQDRLYGELRLSEINIRNSMQPVSSFHPPVPEDQLRQYGLEKYVLDLLDGPEEVLAMLCDNRNIHQTAYTSREVSGDQFNSLQNSPISSWCTATQAYQITRRREYGDQASSTRVQPIKKARFFTDAPIDHQQEEELNRRINEANGEIEDLRGPVADNKEKYRELREAIETLKEEKKALENEKAEKQKDWSVFNGLPVKEQRAQDKLNEERKKLAGYRDRVMAIQDKCDEATLVKGQCCLDYAIAGSNARKLHVELFEAEILQIEAKSDFEQLQEQHAEEQRMIQERQDEVTTLTQEANRLRQEGRRLEAVCTALGANGMSDFESDIHEEILNWHPEQMNTEIESVQARLDMTAGAGGEDTIREYEERERRIADKGAKLQKIDESLEELNEKITNIREQWEPRLDELVGKISDAFAENFSRIQCAGEVAVHKDEDFAEWSIEIKVKFREHEALSVLDSHRQSGGERAVSTIFYLMALQSLARAPFRVVDEINQGMDPRNERLVHSRMVDIACAEHTSQYFLITPKLLNGLRYHPKMKVHCIASGEWMPEDHRQLDFGMLAQRALEIRGGVSVAG